MHIICWICFALWFCLWHKLSRQSQRCPIYLYKFCGGTTQIRLLASLQMHVLVTGSECTVFFPGRLTILVVVAFCPKSLVFYSCLSSTQAPFLSAGDIGSAWVGGWHYLLWVFDCSKSRCTGRWSRRRYLIGSHRFFHVEKKYHVITLRHKGQPHSAPCLGMNRWRKKIALLHDHWLVDFNNQFWFTEKLTNHRNSFAAVLWLVLTGIPS